MNATYWIAALALAALSLSCDLDNAHVEVSFGSQFPDTTSGGLTIRFRSDAASAAARDGTSPDPLGP